MRALLPGGVTVLAIGAAIGVALGIALGVSIGAATGCATAPDHDALLRRLDAARLVPQESGTESSLRGVCAVSESVAWASGGGGTVLRTIDGGATWLPASAPDGDDLDYRDVHAIDASTAWILSAGVPARIYRTDDGGRTWTLQYERDGDGVFFDALEFFDRRRGLAFSDPVDGHLLVVRTGDGGATWTQVDPAGIPAALPGEAGFAASGSCLAVHGRRTPGSVSAGGRTRGARMFRSTDGGKTWRVGETPLPSGGSSGIFSIAFRDAFRGVAVGGNYLEPDAPAGNAMVTADGGETWIAVTNAAPRGYRSVVRWIPGLDAPVAFAAGPTGCDVSLDGGHAWRAFADTGYHAASFVPDAPVGWATGANGRIARIEFSP